MTDERDDLPKHLEFVQDVIDRHARTSFLLKGWSVTLVAAVLLLAVRSTDPMLAMAAGLLPAITFWWLDAFYLQQERMYRALYDFVRLGQATSSDRFNLDASRFASKVAAYWRTLFAPTVFWFHATILLTVVGALTYFSARSGNAPQSFL